MKPLSESFANGEVEAELRDLTVALYNETLAETAAEIDVYGAPHLGPFSLIERETARDGLAVLRTTTEESIRNLFQAWRARNPRRGTHFLRAYIQSLFGDGFDVNQMYQKKSDSYPTNLASADEIGFRGDDESEYFLTSRISVDIETEIVPARVAASLRSTLAARFVLDVRVAKFQESELLIGQNIGGALLCFGGGEATVPLAENLIDQFGESLTDEFEEILTGM